MKISSTGGEEKYALLLTELINKQALKLIIDQQSVCGSACVYIALNTQNSYISPAAIFQFHAGRSLGMFNLANLAEKIDMLDSVQPKELTETMDKWARDYSPNLSSFFNECDENPIRTVKGIYLYWFQMEQIKEGQNTFTCNNFLKNQNNK